MANSNEQSNTLCADRPNRAIRSDSHNEYVDYDSLPVLVMTIEALKQEMKSLRRLIAELLCTNQILRQTTLNTSMNAMTAQNAQ